MRAIATSSNENRGSSDTNERRADGSGFYFSSSPTPRDGARTASPHLTPRETEVLVLLCEGLPNKLICRRLSISTGTVKAHISSILRELGVASRLQAVVQARRLGLALPNGVMAVSVGVNGSKDPAEILAGTGAHSRLQDPAQARKTANRSAKEQS